MRATEGSEPVLLRHACRVAEILDQLERAAEGENLGALDLLDLVGKLARIAGVAKPIAEGIRGRLRSLDGLGAELGKAIVYLCLALPDLLADMVILRQILLLGELQPHDIFVVGGRAVNGKARGVGAAMLETLQ